MRRSVYGPGMRDPERHDALSARTRRRWGTAGRVCGRLAALCACLPLAYLTALIIAGLVQLITH